MLLQAEQMLRPEVPGQRRGDLRFGRITAPVAMLGQGQGIGVARDDVPEDAHPGLSGDIGDDEGQLPVHLHEGFLHPLDRGARPLHERGAVAHIRAEDDDVVGRPKTGAQEAHDVEIPNPLTVRHVALPARHILDVAGIHRIHLKATGLEDLEDGNPVDAGGFHGHARNAAGREPIGQPLQIAGERRKGLDRIGVAIGRHRDDLFAGAAIDAGGVRVDVIQHRRRRAGLRGTTRRRTTHGRLHEKVMPSGTGMR